MSIRTRFEARAAAAALVLALTMPSIARAADDDPMAPYRERFRAGMERYKAGDFAGALYSWEPIYRDVGPQKGYRVAFDLARAYEKFGDDTHAAERYEAFLAEIDARRARGDAIDPLVAKEETEARARLAQVVEARGRIRVEAPAPTSARVDAFDPRLTPFTAYVPPGAHVVTFAPGTGDESRRDVTVTAGQLVSVAPVPPAVVPPVTLPAVAPPAAAPPAPVAATPAPAAIAPPPPTPAAVREPPFSTALLYVGSALTAGAVVVTAVEYTRAASARADFDAARGDPTNQASIRDTYDGARTGAYVGLGASIGLAAITAGLFTWYVAGTKERAPQIGLVVAPSSVGGGGATAGVAGRFW